MANYTFTKDPFLWSKSGEDPTSEEATLGLQGGMALPAAFVNQQWKRTYDAIKEMHDKVEDGTIHSGNELTLGNNSNVSNNSSSVVSGTGNNSPAITSGILSGDNNNVGVMNSGIVSGDSNQYSNASNYCVATFGHGNYLADYGLTCGKKCKSPTNTSLSKSTGDLFIVGNGTTSSRSNAFRVTAAGEVMGTQAYTASGADVCHLVEWLDGNPWSEDRRGLFVTLDGDKIRVATSSDDYIIGVISATPSLICNASTDDWCGKYVTDEFGARVIEDGEWIISDDFDESQDKNYTSRLERPEWGVVGHSGIVIARDDGTCEVNSYCVPNDNGVATKAKAGYRVMKRISENIIQIFVSAPLIINK